MKFCKDCIHHQEHNDDFWKSPTCQRTIVSSSHLDLVSGDVLLSSSKPKTCWSERYSGFIISRISGECGKEDRFFSPITPIEKEVNKPPGHNFYIPDPYEVRG